MQSTFLRRARALVTFLVLTVVAAPLGAQSLPPDSCTESFEATFGGEPGLGEGAHGGDVTCSAIFDDGLGDGPVLYLGGRFVSAAGQQVSNVVRWDGSSWSDVGGGVDGTVQALAVADFGAGEVLCVGGSFSTAGGVPASNLATWDGTNWSAVGAGADGTVYALVALDPSPDVLMVGGDFTSIGGVPAERAAIWFDGGFLAFGDGFDDTVFDYAIHDGEIYAGGEFEASGASPIAHIARWTGSLWEEVGGGLDGAVSSLHAKDTGPDAGLYLGGYFQNCGTTPVVSRRVVRWSGGTWFAIGLPNQFSPYVLDLTFWDDGGGEELYATGRFFNPGLGIFNAHVAVRSGGTWSLLGSGLDQPARMLLAHDDGSGESLWVGGIFSRAGDRGASGIARWDGSSWHATGTGLNDDVEEIHVSTLFGGTPTLYLGGEFNVPGTVDRTGLVAWQSGAFVDLGGSDGRALAFAEFDAGGGTELYVGGEFGEVDGVSAGNLARYDGVGFSEVGGGLDGTVHALAVFDDGGGEALYVGGDFTLAGGVAAANVARWDGSTWTALGLGADAEVLALHVWDDGSGPALFVGGAFDTAGGVASESIARWDGSSWAALDVGLSSGVFGSEVRTLTTFDDGTGEQLYVGGAFFGAPGVPLTGAIARWDGAAWSNVNMGPGPIISRPVNDLAVLHDGNGCRLMVVGEFFATAGEPAEHVASWKATGYAELGPPLADFDDVAKAAAIFDDGLGGGPRVVIGGGFTRTFASEGSYLVSWGGCADGVPAWTDLGFALAGVSGDPLFVGTGTLAPGSVNTANLSNAAPSAMAGLFLSFSSTPTPFAGGTLVPWPPANTSMAMTSPAGTIDLTYPVPGCLFPGVSLFAQWVVQDGAAIAGYALSNALVGTTP